MWSCRPLPLAQLRAGAAIINALLVAHLGPRGVTRGLSRLNGLSLCHCLPLSVHRLRDIDCITISHNVQQALKLICHTEFIGLCDGDKGRLVGSWTQKANTMYGFLNNTKAGKNSGCTNGRCGPARGPSPARASLSTRWPGLACSSRAFWQEVATGARQVG